jgi:hypothetical protein
LFFYLLADVLVAKVTLSLTKNTVGDLLAAIKKAVRSSISQIFAFGRNSMSDSNKTAIWVWEEKEKCKLSEWEETSEPLVLAALRPRPERCDLVRTPYVLGDKSIAVKLNGSFVIC